MVKNMAINWTQLFKKYKGQWVALKDDERTVITHAKALEDVIDKSSRLGFDNPLLFKVPTKIANYIGSNGT